MRKVTWKDKATSQSREHESSYKYNTRISDKYGLTVMTARTMGYAIHTRTTKEGLEMYILTKTPVNRGLIAALRNIRGVRIEHSKRIQQENQS